MPRVTNLGRGVEVSFPAREATQTVTFAEYELIWASVPRIPMIKFIRAQYGLGLYEAKQVVDTIKDMPYRSSGVQS